MFALLAMALLAALGSAGVLTTVTETTIAARHRTGSRRSTRRKAALAHTLLALDRELDWGGVVSGSAWRRYVEAPLGDLIGTAGASHLVTVWVRDAGDGQVDVRASAAHGGRARVVEATVTRRDGSTRVLSWREGR